MADHYRCSHRPWGTYRLRILNLPYSYATFAPDSGRRLRDLIWDNHTIVTH